MWYIHKMEYDSAIKRNEIGSFVQIWMDLESVIQREVSQKEKNKYHISEYIYMYVYIYIYISAEIEIQT